MCRLLYKFASCSMNGQILLFQESHLHALCKAVIPAERWFCSGRGWCMTASVGRAFSSGWFLSIPACSNCRRADTCPLEDVWFIFFLFSFVFFLCRQIPVEGANATPLICEMIDLWSLSCFASALIIRRKTSNIAEMLLSKPRLVWLIRLWTRKQLSVYQQHFM